jgi:general secretion pathway protein G
MTRKRLARRGFSLIELLVVLVILALLVGLVAPRFMDQTKRGQVATAKSQISAFKTALDLYRLDHNGNPPAALEDLISPPNASDGGQWKGPYLKDTTTIPLDPWGNPYEYVVPGPNGQDYEIISYGSDGRPGGSGDAEDISSIR